MEPALTKTEYETDVKSPFLACVTYTFSFPPHQKLPEILAPLSDLVSKVEKQCTQFIAGVNGTIALERKWGNLYRKWSESSRQYDFTVAHSSHPTGEIQIKSTIASTSGNFYTGTLCLLHTEQSIDRLLALYLHLSPLKGKQADDRIIERAMATAHRAGLSSQEFYHFSHARFHWEIY